MNPEVKSKGDAFAKIIEGRVVDDEQRVQVCLKGTVLGFPATLEAMNAGWPFGVSYFIETIEDPSKPRNPRSLKMNIYPRIAHGVLGWLLHVLLLEGRGQKVDDRRLENTFIITYNNGDEARRFLSYPGVYDQLIKLHTYSKFSEILVKAESGLYLAQPINFKALNPDVFRETFRSLADLGQVLFEAF